MEPSVTRRIIAIVFAICGAGVFTYLAIKGNHDAFVALVASVNIVMGFYFGVVAK